MSANQITVQITINAEISKVWNYYTMPEHITQWNLLTLRGIAPVKKTT